MTTEDLVREYRTILFEERREISRRLIMIKAAKKEADTAIKDMSKKIESMDKFLGDTYFEEKESDAEDKRD